MCVMEIDQNVIDEIVRRITNAVAAERIVIFGSAATGEMTRDSDIDLLILEASVPDPWNERLRIREALRGLQHAFDIIVMTSERFEETKGVIGGIAYPVDKQGKVIHEAA